MVSGDVSLQLARLGQFVRLMLPVALGFALLYGALAVRLHSGALGGAALDVLGYAATLVWARAQLRRGRLEAAARTVALALLVMVAVGAPLLQWLYPGLVLIPVAAVALALPSLTGRPLRALLAWAYACVVWVLVAGLVLPPLFAPPPDWARRLVVALAASAAAGLTLLLLLRDHERLRASLEEAEAAGRAKDMFLATLGHELRTPLTSLLGWVQMLAQGRVRPERQARAFASMERSVRAQAQVVEDLLDVSRITLGSLRLDVARVALRRELEAALDLVRPAAEAKALALALDLPAAAAELHVRADPARLQQVLWNLLSNAVKFTPAGGRVDVAVRAAGRHAQVEVRDTGQGIRPEFLPHVFERFRQQDGSTQRVHGGLGLGLALVRHLAELHGAEVEAHSEGEGRGATFTLRWPLAP